MEDFVTVDGELVIRLPPNMETQHRAAASTARSWVSGRPTASDYDIVFVSWNLFTLSGINGLGTEAVVVDQLQLFIIAAAQRY